jgi:hypothetical protein
MLSVRVHVNSKKIVEDLDLEVAACFNQPRMTCETDLADDIHWSSNKTMDASLNNLVNEEIVEKKKGKMKLLDMDNLPRCFLHQSHQTKVSNENRPTTRPIISYPRSKPYSSRNHTNDISRNKPL